MNGPLTVSVEQASTQADPVSTGPIDFIIRTNRSCDFIPDSAFDLSASTVAGELIATVSQSQNPNEWLVSLAVLLALAVMWTLTVPADAFTDEDGISNEAATSIDNRVTIDAVRPTVSIESRYGDPVNAPFDVTITFNESIGSV